MKVCPVCKSRCFDDMDTCYGCLHNFNRDNKVKSNPDETQKIKLIPEDDVFHQPKLEESFIPEFFELDTFPYIEEIDFVRQRGAHEKIESSMKNVESFTLKIEIPRDIIEKYISY